MAVHGCVCAALQCDPHWTKLVCMLQAASQPMEVMAEILSDAADTLQVCCILSTRCQYPHASTH